MTILISHLLLFIYCFYGLIGSPITTTSVLCFLSAIIACALLYFYENTSVSIVILLLYTLLMLVSPDMMLFCPVLFWQIARRRLYPFVILWGGIFLLSCFPDEIIRLLFLTLGSAFAFFFAFLSQRYEELSEDYQKARDDSVEKNLLLKSRNQALLENQNYMIHNATLQERNRIAREIHDNVGHTLSRCILLTGALKAVNKDENCAESIATLQDNLSQAMDAIRTSVHNLHDDSINLNANVRQLINDFSYCHASLNFDIQSDPPNNVRYAFISIVKEALTNVAKHSNATLVTVVLREHPGMYQLIITDNGTTPTASALGTDSPGIGLSNMQERITLLQGVFQINTQDGFQIFISIPKNVS